MISNNARLMVETDKSKLKISVYVNSPPEYTEDDIKFYFPLPTSKIFETIIDLPEYCCVAAIEAINIETNINKENNND